MGDVFPGAIMPESNPFRGVFPDGFHSVTVCAVLSFICPYDCSSHLDGKR